MNPSLTLEQIRRLRLRSQRILRGADDESVAPAQVLREACGLQAQELPSALLGVRARSRGLTATAVEHARQEERSILHCWCLRGTLHLVAVEDARWLIPLLGAGLITGDRRRMNQLGWDDQNTIRGLGLLVDTAEKSGGLTRPEMARLLKEHGLPATGQAPLHLLFRAALEGRLCSGPMRGKQPVFVPFASWAGPLRPLPREEALAELARRFLAAFGPAAPADLATWSRIKIGEARAAFQAIDVEIIRCDGPDGPLWLPASRLAWLDDEPAPAAWARLLPRFDNLLFAYTSRAWLVPPAFENRIFPGGGYLFAALVADDRAAGIWKMIRRRQGFHLAVEPFVPLDPAMGPALANEAADLARFLQTPVDYP